MSAKQKVPESPAAVEFTPDDIKAINAYLQQNPNQLIQIPGIRSTLAKERIDRLKTEDIKTFDGVTAETVENTLEHNLKYLHEGAALGRRIF